MKYTIGPPEAKDFVEIAEMTIRSLVEEVERPDMLNRKDVYDLVEKAIDAGYGLVCKEGEKIVGIIGWFIGNNPYNHEMTLIYEFVWYVLPEYRNKTRVPFMLLKKYSDFVDETGYQATLSLLTKNKVSQKVLERLGFKHTEELYFKN